MNHVENLPGILEELVPLAAGQESAPRFVTKAITDKIVVYYPGPSVTATQRRMIMLALTLCGRCQDDRPTCWQTFVLSWSVAVFPELLDSYKNDGKTVDYEFQEYSLSFLTEVEEVLRAQADEERAGKVPLTFPPHLPNANQVLMTPDLVNAGKLEGLYSYYAMLVYIMGKSIGSENVSSVSSQRPLALIRKRQLYQCEYILIGDGKPSSDNYRYIQSGWVRSTRPRVVTVKHLARLNAAEDRSEFLDGICVNMDMLRNSGQNYIYYIHELLTACKWCLEIPALAASYYHYVKIVKTLASTERWFQPYYKLAFQDTTKVVRRKDIEPLIGVAIFFAAQTKKTMSQYRVNADVAPVVMAFRRLAEKKGIVFDEVNNQQTTEATVV